jgi:hypothetical protein
MTAVTVTKGLQRAARLIPFRTRSASNLAGEYGAVCTPVQTVPAQFREAQAERTAYYMDPANGYAEGFRSKPDHAPRYWVTSYGVPVAWVTLDGRTHYATREALTEAWNAHRTARYSGAALFAMLRHRDAIRASWPERFAMDSMGDPITMSEDGGRSYRFAPAGSRQVCDRQGWVHVVLPDGSCRLCNGAHVEEPHETYA